jgi:branched-chain amino acid transport system ATP-binding protein
VTVSGGSAGPLLDVDGLTTNYGSISALRTATLQVRPGEVVGLVGPNGAGKTTLVSTLAGLLGPAAGTVRFDGADVTGLSPDTLLRRGLALVPEHRRLFPDLTVNENLKIGGITVPARDRADLIDEMVELFPVLGAKHDVSAGYLSGGEAQQLAIARALMSRPRLLMMDEPSLGLAPIIVGMIFDIIRQINAAGVTVLLVEQNAKAALDVADTGYVMETGAISFSGHGKDLLADDRVRKAYLGEA